MSSRSFGRSLAARFAWALLLCEPVIGCTSEREGPAAAPPALSTSTGATPATPTAADATPVALTPVDRAAYDAELAKLRGKVVLVDFWATWCEPCVEQLPHTIELGERLADRGLAVVTVSCDEPTESDRVAKFLGSQLAAPATNLISQMGASPKTMEAFEITTGAVPFYKLYDRKGKLRQTFGIDPKLKTQYTPADIEAAIEQLLAEKG
jgi:thiol-disulfide isomerase/thioredoxin